MYVIAKDHKSVFNMFPWTKYKTADGGWSSFKFKAKSHATLLLAETEARRVGEYVTRR